MRIVPQIVPHGGRALDNALGVPVAERRCGGPQEERLPATSGGTVTTLMSTGISGEPDEGNARFVRPYALRAAWPVLCAFLAPDGTAGVTDHSTFMPMAAA